MTDTIESLQVLVQCPNGAQPLVLGGKTDYCPVLLYPKGKKLIP